MTVPTVLTRDHTALDRVAGCLAEVAGSERLAVVTIPAPAARPELLLRHPEPAMSFLWDPPADEAWAGRGVAHQIEVRGGQRFAELRRCAAELWRRLDVQGLEGSWPAPRLFGGFAFDVDDVPGRDAEPWAEFGDGSFTLPRFLYTRRGGAAALSVAVEGRALRASAARRRLLEELEGLLAALDADVLELGASPRVAYRDNGRPRADAAWTAEIEAIRKAIAAGRYEKIVAARRSRIELEAPLDTVDVLLRLARGLRSSTRFAFCREGSTFLGATPERLIERRGREIVTEALAGSMARGQTTELLDSGKDQREHQLVVDAIVRRMAPLCERLDVAPEPRVRELSEVVHLHTPIRGTLAAPRHVLELVEAIHPTPAVGGVPTAGALRWIAEHERDARGWYAAPVGWFDAAGDGEFAVALRSAVLRGRDAYLYAGGGIVRDSDPELEYEEIALKKRALLKALGALD